MSTHTAADVRNWVHITLYWISLCHTPPRLDRLMRPVNDNSEEAA